MLNLEILIILDVILKQFLKKSIINLYNLFIMIIYIIKYIIKKNKIIVILLNKFCISCKHAKQIFILKITDNYKRI